MQMIFFGGFSSPIQHNDKKVIDIRRKVKIVHPFHPGNGKEYEYLERIRTNKEDRVRCLDENGKVRFFQTKITDVYETTPFSEISAVKCVLKIEDLLLLKNLIDKINKKTEE